MEKINQETLIPIGLAVLIIGSAGMWVADITSRLRMETLRSDQLSSTTSEHLRLIYEINSRLSRIETKLEGRH